MNVGAKSEYGRGDGLSSPWTLHGEAGEDKPSPLPYSGDACRVHQS
ncbi:hypothetical protein [Reticulibacter mediterranei]|nr:hypothetical protein [Reticulibacter mediterranei]